MGLTSHYVVATVWSPELAPLRGLYTKAVGGTIVLTMVVMWICLCVEIVSHTAPMSLTCLCLLTTRPVYWGSLAHQRSYSHNLDAFFINRDGSDIGNAIQQVIEANIRNTTRFKLGWEVVDPNKYPTNQDVIHAVVEERCWVAVVGTYRFDALILI